MNSVINTKLVRHVLGLLLLIEAVFMFLSTIVGIIYQDEAISALFISTGITVTAGILLMASGRNASKDIGKRDGYLIVAITWIICSFFGLLPFYISGAIPNVTDAFFETMSGFTTTGSSILTDIESLAPSLLFWRSIIQWIGGMGIIVLTLAILPALGVGGSSLFTAEVPGPTPDRLRPKITETAKRLWIIYVALTLIQTLLLRFGGMTWFDALCHSFTTMATGGYSTKQASIGHWDSGFIHYVIIAFMFLAGMNFTMTYFIANFNFQKVWRNEEFRWYLNITAIFVAIITLGVFLSQDLSFEESFRVAAFQVTSILTTTGYATADYLSWIPLLTSLLIILFFIGGSAGSTGGGIKVMRVLILLKDSVYELKRLIHPRAVIPTRCNDKAVSPDVVNNILTFTLIYIMIIIMSIPIMSAVGLDFETSFGAIITSIGNVGPGLGSVGPAENFAHIPAFGKWYLSFLMLLGRLELFTVLVVLTPTFWKK
jgi:trk system potassium uptake protein TrkH